MSIQSQITRIANNIQNSLNIIETAGVAVVADANSDDLPGYIEELASSAGDGDIDCGAFSDADSGNIDVGPFDPDPVNYQLQSKRIIPNEEERNITPDAGFYGLSNVVVEAVEQKETSILPDGYTEFEYIQSSGTQYIDTGITVSASHYSTLRIVADAEFTHQSNVWAVSGHTNLHIGVSPSNTFMYGNGGADVDTGISFVAGRHTFDLDLLNKTFVVGSYVNLSNITLKAPGATRNFYISAYPESSAVCHKEKIYNYKIYDNGVIVRDFIPCQNPSGAIGLYDIVNNQFYANAGSGVFSGAGKQSGPLPAGYTLLEYIQSSGTQYIDTGFKPNSNTRVVMDAQMLTATTQFYFCARNTALTVCYDVLGTASGARSDYGSNQQTLSFTATTRQIIDKNKNVCTIGTVTVTNTASTFSCDNNLHLFADNRSGAVAYYAQMKLFSCQIYDNGAIVRFFMPCTDPNGVAGLYDIINGAFYANAGTGTFTTGPALAA